MRHLPDCHIILEMARSSQVVRVVLCTLTAMLAMIGAGFQSASASEETNVLADENLLPWELRWDQGGANIVEPEARAHMLKSKGFQRYALKYSQDSVTQLDAQIAAYQRQGIEISAVYFWLGTERPGEDTKVQAAFESFRRHGIRPQIWVSQSNAFLPKTPEEWQQQFAERGFVVPEGYDYLKALRSSFSAESDFTEEQKENFFKVLHRVYSDEAHLPTTREEQIQRLERESGRIGSLAQLASRYGLDVGLYNHNGWFGLMDNQLAMIQRLEQSGIKNVGIVYTFWHARDSIHDDVKNFDEVWSKIRPHVMAIAISGVRGEMESLYPSEGEDELAMMRTVQGSGWRGRVGVLCLNFGTHPEAVLRNTLHGVNWLAAEVARPGSGGMRPFVRERDKGSQTIAE